MERLAKATNRSTSTISRLCTGSGATYARLKAVDAKGRRKHRITTERVDRAVEALAAMWPAHVKWPADLPRPTIINRDAA